MEEILTQFAYADRIPEEILAWGDELARIRQDLHEHPELGFDTARTCSEASRMGHHLRRLDGAGRRHSPC